jgi:hypothetical protein
MKRLLLFGLLLTLSLSFFSLVRDNAFWHPGDFQLLGQAMDIEESWGQVFTSAPTQPLQPLVKFVFYLEYKLFGLDAWKYYLFNLFIHAINAFLVYFLVYTLLGDGVIAILSSLLFTLAVGNYGKAVMVVSGIGDLLITMLSLLTLLLYFKNELEKGGRTTSPWFIMALICFVLGLMTRATSFSVLGCMLAFNFFFHDEIKKPLLHRGLLLTAAIAFVAFVLKVSLLHDPWQSGLSFNVFNFLRNFGSYLVRMAFPIHSSQLVADAVGPVQFIYPLATEIRAVTFLVILSFTVFGFIFGNRTIRFFIAWTYITLAPFCFFRFPEDWLNIRHLYMVSVGFIMILASTTVLASRLLYQRAWRRFLPYVLPVFFVILSRFIITHLDANYEATARRPAIVKMHEQVSERHDALHR